MAISKRILDSSRVRRPPRSGFSWVDRRFLNLGVESELGASDFLLYFFLCSVADQDGLSFYGEVTIARKLGMPVHEVERSRARLERLSFLVFRAPLYQVLALPDDTIAPVRALTSVGQRSSAEGFPRSFREILRSMA